jgi:predicted HAD superfamily Cof-like phosphohydrolase
MSEHYVSTDTVAEFIKSFNASLDPRLWIKLVEEELEELKEALEEGDPENLLKEFSDLLYVTAGFLCVVPKGIDDLISEEEVDKMLDLFDEAYEFAKIVTTIFTDDVIIEAVERVHQSNMSKLGDDGKPILREDGKILKGPNYKPPYLQDLIQEKK